MQMQRAATRGSQNSLNRPALDGSHPRPASAYVQSHGQQQAYGNPGQQYGPPPRSQSSRDIIRQEAKLQEMQEEVRRRELRGSQPMAQYRPPVTSYSTRPISAAQAANAIRQPTRPAGYSQQNLGPASPTYGSRPVNQSYSYTDVQYNQYNQVKLDFYTFIKFIEC